MKRKIFIGLLMLVAAGESAHAQGFFDDGETLYYTCHEKADDPFAQGACLGTVSGALDMMRALGYVCKVQGVTRAQAKDAVLEYLEDNPEKRKGPAVLNIIEAMEAALDCKASTALDKALRGD
jgi:Rap1a immunity proteins